MAELEILLGSQKLFTWDLSQIEISFAPCHDLPRALSLQAGVWRWGPIARTKMDRKKQKPRRKPHLTQRAWPWGRGAARAAALSQKQFLPPATTSLVLSLCRLKCGAGAL
jgi:hypothetical protein